MDFILYGEIKLKLLGNRFYLLEYLNKILYRNTLRKEILNFKTPYGFKFNFRTHLLFVKVTEISAFILIPE